jgi:hypothetical protein
MNPHTDTGELLRKPAAEAPAPPRMSDVLKHVGTWRTEADNHHQLQLDEVDDEVGRLKTAIEDLQRQLTALADFRAELIEKHERLDAEQAQRAHEGIFERLHADADALEQRAEMAREAAPARAKAITERIAASDRSAQLEEYRQFRTTADQLQSLPASYRDAILAHHKAQEASLAAFAAQVDPGPTSLEAPPVEIDLVFTVDTSDDQPDLVSVVLPVRELVYARWEEHRDDLQLLTAARVVEGLYRAAHALGSTRAHAMYGGHRGLLAVELELAPPRSADAARRVGEAIEAVFAAAPEMGAAKIVVHATQVRTDYLLPPDAGAGVSHDS